MQSDYRTVIDNLRKAKGMSQVEMGNLLHLDQGRISKVLSCNGDFTVEELRILAKHFGVPFDYFFNDAIEYSSLSTYMQMLFTLNDISPFNIHVDENENVSITFTNNHVNSLLKQWAHKRNTPSDEFNSPEYEEEIFKEEVRRDFTDRRASDLFNSDDDKALIEMKSLILNLPNDCETLKQFVDSHTDQEELILKATQQLMLEGHLDLYNVIKFDNINEMIIPY